MSSSSTHWPQSALTILGVAGLVSATLGLAGVIPIEGVAAGATAVAAAVAGIVARSSVITWTETRRREGEAMRRQHQEQIYEEFIGHLVDRFILKQWDASEAAALRARISVWAGPETIHLAHRWNQLTQSLGAVGGGTVSLSRDQQHDAKALVGALVLAMRRDLGEPKEEQPPAAYVIGSIFNG